MALNNSDIKVLQEIVDKEGACLDSKRCGMCPFRGTCLPEFIQSKRPSKQQRFQKALNVLTFHHLLEGDQVEEEKESKEKQQSSGKKQK